MLSVSFNFKKRSDSTAQRRSSLCCAAKFLNFFRALHLGELSIFRGALMPCRDSPITLYTLRRDKSHFFTACCGRVAALKNPCNEWHCGGFCALHRIPPHSCKIAICHGARYIYRLAYACQDFGAAIKMPFGCAKSEIEPLPLHIGRHTTNLYLSHHENPRIYRP